MLAPFGYLAAGKRKDKVTLSEQYIREKTALLARKYYTSEEFEQLLADLSSGLITVQIYDDGIIVDRPGPR